MEILKNISIVNLCIPADVYDRVLSTCGRYDIGIDVFITDALRFHCCLYRDCNKSRGFSPGDYRVIKSSIRELGLKQFSQSQ